VVIKILYGIKIEMFRLLKYEARLIFLSAIFMCLCAPAFSQLQRSLTVEIKCRALEGDLKEAYIVISKQGGSSQTLPATAKFKVDLDFNSTYILSFNKPGYITKKIELNTTMDDERRSQSVHFYDFEVILLKQYDGINIVVFNQPVAKIQYSKKIDDFDYDTDYTKSIQSAMADAEKEIKKKQAEEKKNPKSAPKDSTVAKVNKPLVEEKKNEPLADNKKTSVDEKKEMEKQKVDATPPVNVNDKKADVSGGKDEKKSANAVSGEDSKNSLPASGGNDAKTTASSNGGSDINKNDLAATGKDSKSTAVSGSGEDETKKGSSESGNDEKEKITPVENSSKIKSDVKAGEGKDDKNPIANKDGGTDKLNAKASQLSGSDNYVAPEPAVKREEDKQSFTPPPTIETKIDREEINEDKRSILNVKVTRGDKTIMYSRVQYYWGGVFYFKDMKTSISEHYFRQATSGN
jgi:hypothetical protein